MQQNEYKTLKNLTSILYVYQIILRKVKILIKNMGNFKKGMKTIRLFILLTICDTYIKKKKHANDTFEKQLSHGKQTQILLYHNCTLNYYSLS